MFEIIGKRTVIDTAYALSSMSIATGELLSGRSYEALFVFAVASLVLWMANGGMK